jgi:hypothetical protein
MRIVLERHVGISVASTETAETMRTQAAGSFHENYCFMGQFHKFMTIQPIFDATDGLGWSYTIGIFDTCGKPEIITVGLPPEVAHFALNEAAKLMRAGADLTRGRHRDLVGRVECEFCPVDPKWITQLMGLGDLVLRWH